MNYFKNNNNEIFAYDNEQVKQGYGKDLISLPAGDYYTIVDGNVEFKKFKFDDTYKEFEVATDEVTGISLYYPEELNDAIALLQQQEYKVKQISEAKQYLADTDWIVIKINEATLIGENIEPLLTKYVDILSERENKRLIINQLEREL